MVKSKIYEQTVLSQAPAGSQVLALTTASDRPGFWWNMLDSTTFGLLQMRGVARDISKRFFLVGAGDDWDLWTVNRDQSVDKLDVADSLRGNDNGKKFVANGQKFTVVAKLR